MTGTNCEYSFESLRTHIRSSSSSRQAIMCNNLLNYPISIRGYKQKQIRFHRLPNVVMCQCHLGHALGHRMTIYISFTGIDYIRQTNYLYREEMAVINTALNMTSSYMKLLASSDPTMEEFADQIGRLCSFEQKVKGSFSRNIMNRVSHLGPKAMRLFAKHFDKALLTLMEHGGLMTCMDPKFNGMRFDDDKCELKSEYVQKAIVAVNRGHYYTANLAGFKNCYKEKTEFTFRMDRHFYEREGFNPANGDHIDKYIQLFVDESLARLYEHIRTQVIEIIPAADEMYYFDIGVDIRCLDDNIALVSLNQESLSCLESLLELP
jgi:hypothetical protein